MADKKDRVYASPMTSVDTFRFNETVADVFTDMIERSIPGYGLVLQLIGLLAERYAREGTRVYDLGCSLGASTLQLRRHIPASCHGHRGGQFGSDGGAMPGQYRPRSLRCLLRNSGTGYS